MGDNEVNITYETLFEILRREKSREDLQELDKAFFSNVVSYLIEKQKNVKENEEKLVSDEEKENAQKQLQNIKKLVKELYDRREKKILSMAMGKSRAVNMLMNTAVMLDDEKKLCNELLDILGRYRKGVLFNVINNQLPAMESGPETAPESTETGVDSEEKPKELKTEANSQQKSTKTIRFLSAVPKFLGPNLEVYGPFDQEDIANLSVKIADVLIEKDRAEEVEGKN